MSAFLLFQVQLIVGKHILPWFGGSAAVWTTSLLVFQVLLLAGYVYAHLLTTRLSSSARFTTHAVLLTAAILIVLLESVLWPSAITPGASWRPHPGDVPAATVCWIILISTGLPFFVLSTTAPLLQAWFGSLGYGAKAYRLYALSNLGSLLGLLSFPFLFEPLLRLPVLGRLWTALFCLFAAGCVLCGRRAVRSGVERDRASSERPVAAETPPVRLARLWWFLLAACASSLLLATTNLLCQEVITVPLLWVLPLAIYLVTFIVSFDHPRWYQRAVFSPLFAIAVSLTCAAQYADQNFQARLIAFPLLLFAACMVCHGELARLKPPVRHLTSYYLAISAGGAAGGIGVALIAPHVFTSFLEFPIAIAVATALLFLTLALDPGSWIFSTRPWLPIAMIAGTVAAAYAIGLWLPEVATVLSAIRFYPIVLLIGAVSVIGVVVVERSSAASGRGFRFVQIPVAALLFGSIAALFYSAPSEQGIEVSKRNFYGVIRVRRSSNSRVLLHGQTVHGLQFDPPGQQVPTAYYGVNSGIGVVLRNHPKRSAWLGNLRVGVVGLGVGTLAAYGRAGDTIRYYEINPEVTGLSSGPQPVFTYLRDSAASVTNVLGDARLSLEQERSAGRARQFDVLVLDAFSGDAIPVHLLTKEAFETYWEQLSSDSGIIAVHITSRHVNLAPVLLGAAQHFHAVARLTIAQRDGAAFESVWFLMSKDPDALNIPGLATITVQYVHKVGPRLWTDDHSAIWNLIY